MKSYLELTKPRITLLVVLSSLAGFLLGSNHGITSLLLINTAIGVALLSSGISTLNQYLERDVDALMRRTCTRPLPSGKLSPRSAMFFGIGLSALAMAYLGVLVNPLTAVLGAAAFASYLFLYTPLKTRTTWCTFIGAFPGALPPLLGWTAARNEIGLGGLILFLILFLWQFPHFLAIAWMYREDYARAGVLMLPVVEPDGRLTSREIVAFTAMLLPVSLVPAALGLTGHLYLAGAVVLGLLFLGVSIGAAREKTNAYARRLLQASVVYLPLLLLLMVLDRP